MTIQARFTDDEWFLLSALPAMIGAAMSSAAPSGVIGTMKEISASMKAVIAGQTRWPDSPLIAELLAKSDNWDEAREKMTDYRVRARARLQAVHIESPDDLHAAVLADCEQAAALVDRECEADDAAHYREWVVAVAQAVAESATEGGFLGFGGERVSADEQIMLTRIEAALGIPGGHLLA